MLGWKLARWLVVFLSIFVHGTAAVAAPGGAPTTPSCTALAQQYFGTYVCLTKQSDLDATAPEAFPKTSYALTDYYGYVALNNTGGITIDSASLFDGLKSVLGVKDTYSVVVSVSVDLTSLGKTTNVSTIPIYAFTVTNGKLQSGASVTLNSGTASPLFPLKDAPQLTVHYRLTTVRNIDATSLLNNIKSLPVPGNWLLTFISSNSSGINSTIGATLGNSYDVPIDVKMGYSQDQYAKVLLYSANQQGQTSSVQIALEHTRSMAQPLRPEAYPIFDSTVPLSDQISLSADGKTTLSSTLKTIGIPDTGLSLTTKQTTSGSAPPTDPVTVVNSACNTIRAGLRNSQYIVLSTYDVERVLYDYMSDANLTAQEASAKCVQDNHWRDFGFSLKPFPTIGNVVSVPQASDKIKLLTTGLIAAPTADARLPILQAISYNQTAAHDFTVKIDRPILSANSANAAWLTANCPDEKAAACTYAGVSSALDALSKIKACEFSAPFKNFDATNAQYSDYTVSNKVSEDTSSISSLAVIAGMAQPVFVRFEMDPATISFNRVVIMARSKNAEQVQTQGTDATTGATTAVWGAYSASTDGKAFWSSPQVAGLTATPPQRCQ